MVLLRYSSPIFHHFCLSSLLFILSIMFTPLVMADSGLGVKVGMYFPGGMSVEGTRTVDFETSSGLTAGVDYQIAINDSIFIRPTLDYSSFANGADDGIQLIDVGIDVLYQMDFNGYTIRPYVGVAYGIGEFYVGSGALGTADWVTEETNEFLVSRLGVEIDFNQFFIDVGLRGYEGGNEETVWINHGLLLRGGMRF